MQWGSSSPSVAGVCRFHLPLLSLHNSQLLFHVRVCALDVWFCRAISPVHCTVEALFFPDFSFLFPAIWFFTSCFPYICFYFSATSHPIWILLSITANRMVRLHSPSFTWYLACSSYLFILHPLPSMHCPDVAKPAVQPTQLGLWGWWFHTPSCGVVKTLPCRCEGDESTTLSSSTYIELQRWRLSGWGWTPW